MPDPANVGNNAITLEYTLELVKYRFVFSITFAEYRPNQLIPCILFADIKFAPVINPPVADPNNIVVAITLPELTLLEVMLLVWILVADIKFRPVKDPPDADPITKVFAIILPAVTLPVVT